jgi:transposase
MGRGIRLTHEELNQVDLLRFKTTSADVFRNCLIIVMSHFGDTIAQIAQRLGCGTETVVRIRREYRQRGLDALKPNKSPGRPSRASLGFIEAMKEAVLTSPQDLGYGFSTWSTKRLAAHLKKVTRISFSEDQLRRLLHRHGYSVQRPKHTMKGKRDEVAYQQASRKLDRLKKKQLAPMPRKS